MLDGSYPEADLTLATAKRKHIERVLAICEGNKVRAAKLLEIDRRTLYRFLARFERELDADLLRAGAVG